jgi:hypothetical protein
MSAAIQSICGCCKEPFPADAAHVDSDTEEVTCPECKPWLRDAKAQLARPFDDKGRQINIKGCYKSVEAPDNLVL